MEKINWYPGHMKKTGELIKENIGRVDLVIEIIDARIPLASRNPKLKDLISGKPEIVLLNKRDLADQSETDKWIAKLSKSEPGTENVSAVATDLADGDGLRKVITEIERIKGENIGKKKWERPLRMIVVGIPNVGKSSFINRLTGKKSTMTGNKPGVTKGKQWLTTAGVMQILDTPGILWPNIDNEEQGRYLAFCGAIKDEIYDIADLALELIKYLYECNFEMLSERYKFSEDDVEAKFEEISCEGGTLPLAIMDLIAFSRGTLLPGKKIDYDRCARMILDDFRSGKIGRITLEKVSDMNM